VSQTQTCFQLTLDEI